MNKSGKNRFNNFLFEIFLLESDNDKEKVQIYKNFWKYFSQIQNLYKMEVT